MHRSLVIPWQIHCSHTPALCVSVCVRDREKDRLREEPWPIIRLVTQGTRNNRNALQIKVWSAIINSLISFNYFTSLCSVSLIFHQPSATCQFALFPYWAGEGVGGLGINANQSQELCRARLLCAADGWTKVQPFFINFSPI